MGKLDNTLAICIVGDNGTSRRKVGIRPGTLNSIPTGVERIRADP